MTPDDRIARARAELAGRRRAVAGRGARPAAAASRGAHRGAGAALGVAELYGAVAEVDAVRDERGAGAPTRRRCAAPSTPRCCCPTRSAPRSPLRLARRPRALGLRDRRPRTAADARARASLPPVRGRSQVYYYRAMLAGVGLDASSASPDASPAPARRPGPSGPTALLGGAGAWIGLNPGAVFGTAKRWLPERFAAVGDAAGPPSRARRSRSLGGAAERPLGEAIAAAHAPSPRASSAARRRLPELVGVLSRLRLLVTNDSGPMHVAAALGVPRGGRVRPDRLARDGAGGRRAIASCASRSTARPACCASARSTTAA